MARAGTSCESNLVVLLSVMVTMRLTRPTQPPSLVRSHLIKPPGCRLADVDALS